DRPFTLGMLAAGGTLGILIPPSIPLIIYGIITEQSIPTLFLAGIGPGLFLASVFVIYGTTFSAFGGGYTPSPKASWAERGRATALALPTILLAAVIILSIYTGVATPSESAGVGFVTALVLTFAMGRMTWDKLRDATHRAMITTAMIFMIILGAKVFSYAITLYLIPQSISQLITENISDANWFMLAVGGVLLLIGFFLEALSMLLIMVPVLYPSLEAMGINPIWFGIFFVLLIETALITPPVGLNLFVIQAVGKARLGEVVKGAAPFALIMLCTAVLLWFWQDLALWIPGQ
ncbi:MAG: TRAP transporter large permease, partial [Pseudomonadota bacterium]